MFACPCDRANLIDPAIAERVADTAPHAVIEHYDADHFTVYHPPAVEKILAHQIRFLTEHLF
ncbi:hypothetical protein [Nocardia tengchongensis]|uniref:hypothetical protein n=1 Tax=Nocardia tengchongensis TaxID=2055889 RepID=UPI003681AEBF